MMLITSLPAAEPVSSDSATETSETPRRWNRSSSLAPHRRYIDRVFVVYLFQRRGRQPWKHYTDTRSQRVELMMHLVGLPQDVLPEPNPHCRVAVSQAISFASGERRSGLWPCREP